MASLEIDPVLVAKIEEYVASGRYKDADEVLQYGLKLLAEYDSRMAAFRQSLIDADDEITRTGGVELTPDTFGQMKQRAKGKLLAGQRVGDDGWT